MPSVTAQVHASNANGERDPMRMKRKVESDEHRRQRLEQNAQQRLENVAAANKAADDMVRLSIGLHGA